MTSTNENDQGPDPEELAARVMESVCRLMAESDGPSDNFSERDDWWARLHSGIASVAYRAINEEFRRAGADPSFTVINCAECRVGHYRDDIEPDLKWAAPNARWRCKDCGRPLDTQDLVLEPGEDWAIRDHTLGYITKVQGGVTEHQQLRAP